MLMPYQSRDGLNTTRFDESKETHLRRDTLCAFTYNPIVDCFIVVQCILDTCTSPKSQESRYYQPLSTIKCQVSTVNAAARRSRLFSFTAIGSEAFVTGNSPPTTTATRTTETTLLPHALDNANDTSSYPRPCSCASWICIDSVNPQDPAISIPGPQQGHLHLFNSHLAPSRRVRDNLIYLVDCLNPRAQALPFRYSTWM